MPPKIKVTKEMIVETALKIVEEKGIEHLNARILAKYLNCSTQPIFRVYDKMEDLKYDLKLKMDQIYTEFISCYIGEMNTIETMSMAYIKFAQLKPRLFEALFITMKNCRSMNEVLNSSWNIETIKQTANHYHLNDLQAQNLYLNIRFYSMGIAFLIYSENLKITDEEIESLIKQATLQFLK